MSAADKVAIFCPLPPKPNGIADYLAEQLPYLTEYIDVTVVIEDHAPEPVGVCPRTKVLYCSEYLSRWTEFASVPHVYHVGNNPDTQYMLEILLNRPGITVVHDLNLHYLIDLTNLTTGDKAGYTRALINQYGSQGKIIGDQLAAHGWKGRFMPRELMMHSSIIDASSQIVVHSTYSKQKIMALGHCRVSLIPHHLSPGIRKFQTKLKMSYRGQLGLPGNKVIMTSMGFIAQAKQIKAVLNSLAELKAQGLNFVYVLAGQCKPHEYDVYQDIADSGLTDNVIVTGFLNEENFFKYLLASDFIINLRYPTGGESSGTLTRAMGLGVSCMVVNIGPFAEIPDECAVKLDYDDSFQENLTTALKMLIDDPIARVQVGLNARRWVESTHNIIKTTGQYRELIDREKYLLENRELVATSKNCRFWCFPSKQSIEDWLLANQPWIRTLNSQDSGALWWLNNTVPVNVTGEVIFVGKKATGTYILTSLYGYKEENIYIFDPFEIEQVSADNLPSKLVKSAIVVIPLRAIEYDPVRYFSKLNQILVIGARVSLTIQPDKQVHTNIPLARNQLKTYLEASGFNVDAVHCGLSYVDMHGKMPKVHHEEWCFEITKASWMINKTPPTYRFKGISELKWLQPAIITQSGRGLS